MDTWTVFPGDAMSRITYSVADFSGNAAPSAHRHISVGCPRGEEPCPSSSPGLPGTCSAGGVCAFGFDALEVFVRRVSSGAPALSIALVGPEVVALSRGDPFFACPPNSPAGFVCDRGVEVIGAVEGSLRDRVEVSGEAHAITLVGSSGGELVRRRGEGESGRRKRPQTVKALLLMACVAQTGGACCGPLAPPGRRISQCPDFSPHVCPSRSFRFRNLVLFHFACAQPSLIRPPAFLSVLSGSRPSLTVIHPIPRRCLLPSHNSAPSFPFVSPFPSVRVVPKSSAPSLLHGR